MKKLLGLVFLLTLGLLPSFAGEADINIPDLSTVKFGSVSGLHLMYAGLVVCVIGLIFGLIQYKQTKAMPVHKCMSDVSQTIWETCKTYLFQQGKFLAVLWVLIGACMVYYFVGLPWHDPKTSCPIMNSSATASSSSSARSSAFSAPTASPGSASGSTRRPTRARRSPPFAAHRGWRWLFR